MWGKQWPSSQFPPSNSEGVEQHSNLPGSCLTDGSLFCLTHSSDRKSGIVHILGQEKLWKAAVVTASANCQTTDLQMSGTRDHRERNATEHPRPWEEAGKRVLKKLRHFKEVMYTGGTHTHTQRSLGKRQAQKSPEKSLSHHTKLTSRFRTCPVS